VVGLTYGYLANVPTMGTLYLDVTYAATTPEADYGPTAGSYDEW
jgi:hypothetical protein